MNTSKDNFFVVLAAQHRENKTNQGDEMVGTGEQGTQDSPGLSKQECFPGGGLKTEEDQAPNTKKWHLLPLDGDH